MNVCYGDESGQLRNLLSGHCERFVIAAISGDTEDCMRCPKRTLRQCSSGSKEAKWRDLDEVGKRRMISCLSDQDISVGYVAFTIDCLRSLDRSDRLYNPQNSPFDDDWDLCVMGFSYHEILTELLPSPDAPARLKFDRFRSGTDSNPIAQRATIDRPQWEAIDKTSESVKGIQAADCIAGAIAEDLCSETHWTDMLDVERTNCTDATLEYVEHCLTS